MINLRYHIVSLTAVFLALGLGILTGTTVIDQEVVKGLRANTRALQNDFNDMQDQRDALQAQVELFEGFSDAVVPPLLQGLLAGRAVVVLADRETPSGLIRSISDALTLAGAKRPTRITLTDRWSLEQTATMQQLATVLGVASSSRDDLVTEAAARIAERLAGSSDPRAQSDLLGSLEDSGFLDVDDLPPGSFPAANAVVVVISSGAEGAIPDEDTFFMPLLRKLSAVRVVGVAEAMGVPRSLAEKVRGDRALSRSVCTVDHADTVAGRLSLAYALRDVTLGRPAPHFGVRGGAQAVAPDVRP
ncbi:MAG: copper transporter [Actinomycetota bacterium]